MTAIAAPPPKSAQPSGRVAAIVTASLLGVGALSSFAVGGGALYGDGQKDADGYLTSSAHRFSTERSAIASDDLDVDAHGSGKWVSTDNYGKVRFKVDSASGKPVFVGIAKSSDVDAYLRGTDHTQVDDVDFDPFHADYSDAPSQTRPAAPAAQHIWAASSEGTGRRTVTWDVKSGDWSMVVMNADSSPGVDAKLSAGANVPVLDDIGWGGIGVGLILTLLSGVMVGVITRLKEAPTS
jgi:hypothetical protein